MADSIVVPARPVRTPPIVGLPELQAHLSELVNDDTVPLNAKLLDDIQLQLTEESIPPLLPTLLPPLTQILKSTAQDPTPLVSLSIKLLSPLSFTQALAIADPPSLLTALRSSLPGANLLALAVIRKAAHAPSDAAILSTLPHVVEELVRRWLESPDVSVGEGATKVLGDLLETDCEVQHGPDPVKRRVLGHARLWRLILQSRPHLSLIQSLCTASQPPSRSLHDISISQGRLLRLLPRLATLNIRVLSHTAFPDLFPLPEAVSQHVGRGLLQWAALGMATIKSDMLLHLTVIDFFETFVSIMRVFDRSPETDDTVKSLVRAAVRDDADLDKALRSLPDRTAEEEAEGLRRYIGEILG